MQASDRTQIYLVRHGETDWNKERRYQGQTDRPLSEVGHRQAREAAVHLADVPFDAAYVSDLTRARQTLEAVLSKQAGAPALTVDRMLREVSDGIYEGWNVDEAHATEPRTFRRLDGDTPAPDYAPPEGESIRQVFERQLSVASRLTSDHPGQRVLVVGHGWALRLLAGALLGRGLGYFWEAEGLRNASVSILEHREGPATISVWNQTEHLSDKP